MPTVYKTGHSIADRVADAFAPLGYKVRDLSHSPHFESSDCHIAYGILRGTGDIYHKAKNRGEKFIFLDKGFLRPGHFEGYYRFGLNRFQQAYEAHTFNTERLEKISTEILDNRLPMGHEILVIPPSEYVSAFYNLGSSRIWLQNIMADLAEKTERPIRVRFKSSQTPIDQHLDKAYCVVTHSSSVGWEAIRRGIPAIGMKNSIVYDWNGLTINDIDTDRMMVDTDQAIRLFMFMAEFQFTLEEISKGMANHLIEGFRA